MRKSIPVLLLILLIPAGYYITSYWGGSSNGSSDGKNITHAPTGGCPIIENSTPECRPMNDFMKLDKTVYSPTDTMVISITNNGNANFTTGYHFKLYRLENGTWKEVPVNLAFIEVAVVIEPGKSWEQRVNLAHLNLKPGHYRIEKTVVVTDPVNKMSMGIEAWTEFDVRG
ncbi:immunoglobulin-like domain-containing protein [Thermococcus radiotolerans]|uniref:Bacterial Ig-like domain-containing protein n=1 Tax=Thermococcus radiotolerans TaxID=187880 RepID=A0A2Z2MWW5_9EURY|nr:immunoglobulin-like domain-containing protein [Thermococcus radiotolerans]ASJ13921.1 hypothetical protein A3L10_01765 [Thermococcus radiotolerans]